MPYTYVRVIEVFQIIYISNVKYEQTENTFNNIMYWTTVIRYGT